MSATVAEAGGCLPGGEEALELRGLATAPPAMEVQHPVDGVAQLAGRRAGVEHAVVGGVRRRAQDRGEERAACRISDGAVDPLLGGVTCPPLGLGTREPGECP